MLGPHKFASSSVGRFPAPRIVHASGALAPPVSLRIRQRVMQAYGRDPLAGARGFALFPPALLSTLLFVFGDERGLRQVLQL